ncbi:hypothetical protein BGZ83_006386 [Gryganskiella cystojenkinii]|nr:hypothetical protein BGZ83_006386 [Gryganskiella cystojenkinii]
MSNSMDSLPPAEKVFSIPELAGMIAKYLKLETLAKLSSTTKLIQATVTPYLWRNFILDRDIEEEPSPGLDRYLKYTRSVEFRTCDTGLLDILTQGDQNERDDSIIPSTTPTESDANVLSKELSTSLTRLVYTGDQDGEGSVGVTDDQTDQLLSIMHRNISLETLRLPGELLRRADDLTHVLSGLSRLRSVALVNCAIEGPDISTAFQFFAACFSLPQLEVIRCSFRFDLVQQQVSVETMFRQILESLQGYQSSGQFPSGLKELELPLFSAEYPETFLIPFFSLGFQALEVLHVPSICSPASIKKSLEDVLLQHCSRVRDVRMNGVEHRRVDYEMLGLVVRICCSQLGCRSLELSSMEWTSFHKDIVFHHAQTLESLVIQFPFFMTSRDVQLIFASCPVLKVFKLDGEGSGFVLNYTDFEMYEVRNDTIGAVKGAEDQQDGGEKTTSSIRDFACSGLRTLSLTSGNPHRLQNQGSSKGFFSQVGRLSDLEELTFGYSQFGYNQFRNKTEKPLLDFTLDPANGRLQDLIGLKKLRVLNLRGKTLNQLGQAEVEFMEREWPRLEKVTFGSWIQIEPQSETDHWKWFIDKRPWLKFILRGPLDPPGITGLYILDEFARYESGFSDMLSPDRDDTRYSTFLGGGGSNVQVTSRSLNIELRSIEESFIPALDRKFALMRLELSNEGQHMVNRVGILMAWLVSMAPYPPHRPSPLSNSWFLRTARTFTLFPSLVRISANGLLASDLIPFKDNGGEANDGDKKNNKKTKTGQSRVFKNLEEWRMAAYVDVSEQTKKTRTAHRQIFGRLASLTKLKILDLSHEEHDSKIGASPGARVIFTPGQRHPNPVLDHRPFRPILKLQHSLGLDQLATLQKLKSLRIRANEQTMAQADWVWILETCPRLEEVQGSVNTDL